MVLLSCVCSFFSEQYLKPQCFFSQSSWSHPSPRHSPNPARCCPCDVDARYSRGHDCDREHGDDYDAEASGLRERSARYSH